MSVTHARRPAKFHGYVGVKGLEGNEAEKLQAIFDAEGDTCTVCHRLKNDHTEGEAARCVALLVSEALGSGVNVVGP